MMVRIFLSICFLKLIWVIQSTQVIRVIWSTRVVRVIWSTQVIWAIWAIWVIWNIIICSIVIIVTIRRSTLILASIWLITSISVHNSIYPRALIRAFILLLFFITKRWEVEVFLR